MVGQRRGVVGNFGRQVLCSFYAGTLPLAAVAGAGVGRSPEYR